ncbi:hypothetical protein Pcinc_002797 [Petrolisthes cinctipes]|uniref:Uncharacterized protein n=1 Tax=Petrolisthes cinctipes TaxID=88211 RepID=A0AAE1L2L6_PETCI|nr:hypothetical protein Pcinc_002797 [Petrolisthes cinctipes]
MHYAAWSLEGDCGQYTSHDIRVRCSIVRTTEAADSGLTTFLFIIIINNVCYIRMEYDEPLINLVASCPWIYDTAH